MKNAIAYTFLRYSFIFGLLGSLACTSTYFVSKKQLKQLSTTERAQADSLLRNALDHEALYTLLSELKPISSIGQTITYPIAKDSSNWDGQAEVTHLSQDGIRNMLGKISSWYKITQGLSSSKLQFLLLPYRRVGDGKRNFQILVCRRDLVDQTLQKHAAFFGQWGFVPGADIATLLTTIEFEDRHDRYRAYGYLFGYPDHAVDFFVEASRSEAQNQQFIPRDFFQIPVHSGARGYFTYALPKGKAPSQVDSILYRRATEVLAKYRRIRPRYVREGKGLEARRLLRKSRGKFVLKS